MNDNIEFNFGQPKKENNNKIVYLILIGVIVIGLIVGIVFLVKGNKDDKNTNQVENKGTTPTEPDKKPKKEQVLVEKAEANKKLDRLNVVLHFALDYRRGSDSKPNWFKKENIVYDQELLSTEAEKNDFVFGTIYLTGLEKDNIVGQKSDGTKESGYYAIRKATFVKTFEGLLGAKLPDVEKYPSNNSNKEYVVQNTYLYGYFWLGWPDLGTILKHNDFTNNGDGTFTLIVDVLSGYEASKATELADPKLDSGYDQFVTAQLKLELAKLNDDLYSIKSMQFIKLEK